MTGALIAGSIVLAIVVVVLLSRQLSGTAGPGRARRQTPSAAGSGRILFPFGVQGPTPSALDVALRLARAEGATLVPVFLARVALHLPLEAPLPRQSGIALPIQEAIEQRAASFGVPVDSRIERGRSYRHALRQTIEHERYDRLVVAAQSTPGGAGFDPQEIAWMLRNAPGEIVVLRPSLSGDAGPPPSV
jgi:nucleotide-binding universal stress UspA family protein